MISLSSRWQILASDSQILRNECDEEFRNIQKQVRSTIQDLFKIALKTKLPTKKNSEIAKLLDEKFKGYITEDECLEILRYIYKDDDFKEIREKVERSMAPGEIKSSSIQGRQFIFDIQAVKMWAGEC